MKRQFSYDKQTILYTRNNQFNNNINHYQNHNPNSPYNNKIDYDHYQNNYLNNPYSNMNYNYPPYNINLQKDFHHDNSNNIHNMNFNRNFDNNNINKFIDNIQSKDKKNEGNENNIQNSFKKEILKIFTFIFYYEKYLSEKKENTFNNKEKYYLINPEWIQNFKKYYNYEKLYVLLLKEYENKKYIDYNNLYKYIDEIILNFYNNNILNYDKTKLSEDLINIKKMNCIANKKYNIIYLVEGMIYHSKIINLIKNLFSNISKSFVPRILYFKNNNIFYINKPNIIIGNLNDGDIFIPKYIINFNSNDFFEKEKKNIESDSFNINEYLKFINPNKNNNFFKNEEFKIIFVNQTKENRNKSNNERNMNNKQNIENPKKNEKKRDNKNFNNNEEKIINDNKTKQNQVITDKLDDEKLQMNDKLKEVKNNLNDKINEINSLKKDNELMKRDYLKLEKELELAQNKIKELENYKNDNILELEKRENIISNKEKEIRNKEENIDNKNKLFKEKALELQKRENEIKKNEEYIKNRNDELIKRENNILEKERDIYNKFEEMNKEIFKKESFQKENEEKYKIIKKKELDILEKEKANEELNQKLIKKQSEILNKENNIQKEEKILNENKLKLENRNKLLNEKEYQLTNKEKEFEKDIKRRQSELLNKELDLKNNIKILKEKEIEIKKQNELLNQRISKNEELNNKQNEILKKEEEYNNKNNLLKIKEKEILKKEEDYIKKRERLSSKEKEILKREEEFKKQTKQKEIEFNRKNNNLKKRESDINKKENDYNKKIAFLEEKEVFIEKEMQKLDKKDDEIKQKENILIKKQSQHNIQNNNLQFNNNPIGGIFFNEGFNKFSNNNMINNNNLVNNNQMIENKGIQNVNNLNGINNQNIHKRSKSSQNLGKQNYIETLLNPPLIGLDNIGSTCFKNSVLQCLSQTKDLTNYFLKETSMNSIFNNNIAKKNPKALQLCPVYYELIQNLWSKNKIKSFSPSHFMNVVEILSQNDILQFKKGEAGDAKDFIIFILEQFHKELYKSIKNNNSIEAIPPLNQYDKNNALRHFFEDFKEKCSIISDLFFGVNETNTICLNCKNYYNSRGIKNPVCYNYGTFNCLIFPLLEVKKMKGEPKIMFNNFLVNQNDSLTLYDCFAYNEKSEIFTGQNQNFCNVCKRLSDAKYTTKIFISPIILILILNRGKGNIYNIKLDFDEDLDITSYVINKVSKK